MSFARAIKRWLKEAVQGYQKINLKKKLKKKKKKIADLPTLYFCGLKPETNLFFWGGLIFKMHLLTDSRTDKGDKHASDKDLHVESVEVDVWLMLQGSFRSRCWLSVVPDFI